MWPAGILRSEVKLEQIELPATVVSAMLSTFGPGWFYNVFGVSVELDNEEKVVDDGEMFALPWFSFNGKSSFISSNDFALRGRVKLVTHNNRHVAHCGVVVCFRQCEMPHTYLSQVTVDEYIHLLDPFVCVDVKKFSTIIAKDEVVR